MGTQRFQDFAVWVGSAQPGYWQCVELGLTLRWGVSSSVWMGHVRMGRTC
jgi:hypothetical protein